MARLRADCPWDSSQTHRSLVPYLVEEAIEAVEAIESGDVTDLREELGDLLLQVVFHARIAEEDEGFDLDDVASGIADKLVRRHPHVFDGELVPEDLHGSWESRKAAEKGRVSVLQGIPEQLSALSRASKIISRCRSHQVKLALPDEPIDAAEVGRQALALAARAHASGLDAEQAVRDAVRRLEADVRSAEIV
jgi:XTP/dITP diphosphohydrolase